MLPEHIKQKSIGSFVAEKIVDLAQDTNCNHVLDEISIYGTSDKDGSATLAFEWLGKDPTISNEIFEFFNKIRFLLIGLNKETVEQEFPSKANLQDTTRVIYRFRIWPMDGKYEFFNREPVVN